MHRVVYAVMRCPSVRPSVRLSRSCIVSKRVNIFSTFFHNLVDPPLEFFRTKRYGNIQTGTSLTGASNAGGYDKSAIFDQYLALSPKRATVTMERR